MSPKTLEIDLRFRTAGRIKKRSGTSDPKTRDAIIGMLRTLDERGRGDLLVAVKRGELEMLDLLETYRMRGLAGLPTADHCKPLASAVTAWLKSAELAQRTRRDYRFGLDVLLRLAGEGATISSLPGTLEKYRDRAKGKVTFNRVRAAARSFAGKHTDIWAALSKIKPYRERRADGTVLTPEQARDVATYLGHPHGRMFWTLCCTGMSGGPEGPYFLDAFDIFADKVKIHGTKTEGRERTIPRLTTPMRKLTEYAAFRRAMQALGLRPNDGRHTFKHWVEMCIPEPVRRARYMGHGPKDTDQKYGFQFPIGQYLKEDTERLRAFIGRDWEWNALEKMA